MKFMRLYRLLYKVAILLLIGDVILILVFLFGLFFFFFFSSRRRHTRYIGDWSSDVCSSDLEALFVFFAGHAFHEAGRDYLCCSDTQPDDLPATSLAVGTLLNALAGCSVERSEERRVGKEGRCRVGADESKRRGRVVRDGDRM